jgi:hypothetical protein
MNQIRHNQTLGPVANSQSKSHGFLEATTNLETFLLEDVVAGDILVRNDDQIIRTVRIDLDLPEFASRDLVLKQDVQFGVGETLQKC